MGIIPEKSIDNAVNCLIYGIEDPFLKYLPCDSPHIDILQVLGIEGQVLNSEMVKIKGIHPQSLIKILKEDDIIFNINGYKPLECFFDSSQHLKIQAIRDYNTIEPNIIIENVILPHIVNEHRNNYECTKNTLYIRLTDFNMDIENVIKILETYYESKENLVFDLRNNTGGSFKNMIKLLGTLLPKESILFCIKDKYDLLSEYIAKEDGLYSYKEVIILLNNFSMSASEIFAISLKENLRARIIGERSYGKSLVQKKNIVGKSNLIVPVYECLSPEKKRVHTIGVMPNVFMKDKHIDAIIEENIDNLFNI